MVNTTSKGNRIVIGFLSNTIKGPIPIITSVYVNELKHKHDIVPFYMERSKGKKKLASFNFLNFFYFIKHYLSWCLLILRYKPEIVHFPITSYWNMEKSLLFLSTARILGAKYTIGHLHGGAFITFWQNTSKLRKAIALKQLRKLDLFIVLSESWRKKILENIEMEESKIKVLYNLIDSEFESHFLSSVKVYDKTLPLTLLGFNLMDSKKGIFDLIESISHIPDQDSYKLVIIGDEREPGVFIKANNLIQEKGIKNVSLKKGVWGNEKNTWFEQADILVLPSYVENFPVVILEAACAGIPVIATKVGALPDIFTHNHDILFIEPGNTRHLTEVIEYLVNNLEERKRLGVNIKNTFEKKLRGKIIIDQLDQIYTNFQ